MNIAFFSENKFVGKISRKDSNLRTDLAWISSLNADHYDLDFINNLKQHDIGIIIISKSIQTDDDYRFKKFLQKIDIIKSKCKKIGIMQEGPHDYFQDGCVETQFGIIQLLIDVDFVLCHNDYDVVYYKGLLNKKHVYKLSSLMIEDNIVTSDKKINNSIIMGGNFCKWYGGIDSYIVIRHIDIHGELNIYAPSMGRMKPEENRINNITYFPYLIWKEWISLLSSMMYGIHLMRTFAAGTFALNCGFLGIPCIGYKEIDTQRVLHPATTVNNIGDLDAAQNILKKLTTDKGFYNECSSLSKINYNKYYSESIFLEHMNNIFQSILND